MLYKGTKIVSIYLYLTIIFALLRALLPLHYNYYPRIYNFCVRKFMYCSSLFFCLKFSFSFLITLQY